MFGTVPSLRGEQPRSCGCVCLMALRRDFCFEASRQVLVSIQPPIQRVSRTVSCRG